jgi:hypothetical protein
MPYHVEFYNRGEPMDSACPDHNIIANSFEDIASVADGRVFVIMGPATMTEYLDFLAVGE